eukprot:4237684-Pyramimonas_sp.AAC.1
MALYSRAGGTARGASGSLRNLPVACKGPGSAPAALANQRRGPRSGARSAACSPRRGILLLCGEEPKYRCASAPSGSGADAKVPGAVEIRDNRARGSQRRA